VAPTTYEIRISGTLPEDVAAEFGDVQVMATAVSTVLTGDVADQSALLGLLARLRALGLTVLEVRRTLAAAEPDPPPDQAPPDIEP
jgi:hypothetical protein